MLACFYRSAANTLDHLLAGRETQRLKSGLTKTWGASLHALTLSSTDTGHAVREPAAWDRAEVAGRFATLSLRLAQAEAARDASRAGKPGQAGVVGEGMWEIRVAAGDHRSPACRFWWSPQLRRLLGFETVAEFPDTYDSWASRIHPEDQPASRAAFAAHLDDRSGQTAFDVCYRLKHKDGEYRWFRARGQTRRTPEGVPLNVLGVLSEIPATR